MLVGRVEKLKKGKEAKEMTDRIMGLTKSEFE